MGTGRVVDVRPEGGLCLEDDHVLPLFLAQPQASLHVRLQAQQSGQGDRPGVSEWLPQLAMFQVH